MNREYKFNHIETVDKGNITTITIVHNVKPKS